MKKELNEILTTLLQLTFQGVNGVKGSVFFIGIGGIGMSALARYFNAMGKKVAGYDKTPTILTDELIAEGIDIHFEDHIRNIPTYIKALPFDVDNILIVFTPAVPKDHSEYVFFNLKMYSYT